MQYRTGQMLSQICPVSFISVSEDMGIKETESIFSLSLEENTNMREREQEYFDNVDMEAEAVYAEDSVILVGEREDKNSRPFLMLDFKCVKPLKSCKSYYRIED